jgi:hypothetical protein
MISVATYFDEYYITESEIIDNIKSNVVEKYKSNIINIKKQLADAGVEIETIEKIVKPHALAAAKEIKNGNVKNVGSHFHQVLEEMKETNIFAQLGKSLLILLIVLVINTFGMIILISLGIDKLLILPILAVFIAPLTEEAGKYFSIKEKATGLYFLVFNFFEFTSWVSKLLMMGVSLPVAVFGRLLAVMLHFATTSIQWGAIKQGKDKQGYLLAVAVHALWNLFGVLGNVLEYIGFKG